MCKCDIVKIVVLYVTFALARSSSKWPWEVDFFCIFVTGVFSWMCPVWLEWADASNLAKKFPMDVVSAYRGISSNFLCFMWRIWTVISPHWEKSWENVCIFHKKISKWVFFFSTSVNNSPMLLTNTHFEIMLGKIQIFCEIFLQFFPVIVVMCMIVM